jgi:GNAT superfamily N-acetyltransferase
VAIGHSSRVGVGEPGGVTSIVRPARGDADLDASLGVYNAVFPRDAVSVEEAKAFYASTLQFLELIAEVDGAAVGSGLGALRGTDPGVALAIVAVLPDARRHGVGSGLFDEIRRWAGERGAQRLETWVNEEDEASLAYARRRGFEIYARETGLELDLATATPEVAPPDGIRIVCLADRPELAEAMYDVASEANPDVPGSEDYVMPPRAEFVERHLRSPDALPEGTFVALAGDEAVGYAKLRPAAARPGVALHGLTAVKRAWRRRGIAGALKRAQIAWAAGAGHERLVSANELRNEPIRRLNERLGYREIPGRITLRAEL